MGHLVTEDQVVFPKPTRAGSDPLLVLDVPCDGTKMICLMAFPGTQVRLTGLQLPRPPLPALLVAGCHICWPPVSCVLPRYLGLLVDHGKWLWAPQGYSNESPSLPVPPEEFSAICCSTPVVPVIPPCVHNGNCVFLGLLRKHIPALQACKTPACPSLAQTWSLLSERAIWDVTVHAYGKQSL